MSQKKHVWQKIYKKCPPNFFLLFLDRKWCFLTKKIVFFYSKMCFSRFFIGFWRATEKWRLPWNSTQFFALDRPIISSVRPLGLLFFCYFCSSQPCRDVHIPGSRIPKAPGAVAVSAKRLSRGGPGGAGAPPGALDIYSEPPLLSIISKLACVSCSVHLFLFL